ncbi:type II toxin-antitoxin system HigB family toxin [Candidatus Microgenomates bacterium]|nr:MAG: type II toxin-antitoxin system HigB family toxin [Candidatus Microgenomates bacterium]
MKLVGVKILHDYQKKHADLVSQLDSWVQETKDAMWIKPLDVKKRYASADFLKNNHVVINLKGNKYRLLFRVNYELGIVAVKKIGTHSEYNRWKLD